MTLNRIKVKQWKDKLKDTEIAQMLGITRVYWNSIKNGKYSWNDKLEMRARRAFPDLFLSSDITNVTKDFMNVTQNSPELGVFRRLLGRLHLS